ncbi:MAG: hypothetical protein R3C52_08975 [Hyphomonadaceae bacterium]
METDPVRPPEPSDAPMRTMDFAMISGLVIFAAALLAFVAGDLRTLATPNLHLATVLAIVGGAAFALTPAIALIVLAWRMWGAGADKRPQGR